MRKYMPCLFLFLVVAAQPFAQKTLSSPGGRIKIDIDLSKGLNYAVAYDGKGLLLPSPIDLQLTDGQHLGSNLSIKKSTTRSVSDSIIPPVAEKRRVIKDQYNEL